MRILLRLIGFAQKYWLLLSLAFICLIATTAFSLAVPWMPGAGIDAILCQGERSFLSLAAGVVFGAGAAASRGKGRHRGKLLRGRPDRPRGGWRAALQCRRLAGVNQRVLPSLLLCVPEISAPPLLAPANHLHVGLERCAVAVCVHAGGLGDRRRRALERIVGCALPGHFPSGGGVPRLEFRALPRQCGARDRPPVRPPGVGPADRLALAAGGAPVG